MTTTRPDVPLLWARRRPEDKFRVSRALSTKGGCSRGRVARASPYASMLVLRGKKARFKDLGVRPTEWIGKTQILRTKQTKQNIKGNKYASQALLCRSTTT